MRPRYPLVGLWGLAAGAFVGAALSAQAQSPAAPYAPAPGFAAQALLPPGQPTAAPGAQAPSTPQQPGPQAPGEQAPPTPEEAAQAPAEAPAATGTALALGGLSYSATGYIDNAVPITMFRLRFDAAYDDNRPDRAEFFYGKCGCFAGLGAFNNPAVAMANGFTPAQGRLIAANADPRARGLGPNPEARVDYQEISSYLEIAVSNRLSGFVEAPVRFLNPEVNPDHSGFGDMNAGFKYAVLACDDHFLTFQFRTYIPTGNAREGLGTDHVSLEPAVLWHQRLGDRLALDSEFRDWIPIDSTDFAGNVTRYGVGLSYLLLNGEKFRIIPVGEVVGWTVLSGKELVVPSVAAAEAPFTPGPNDTVISHVAVKDAAGDTIVNAKMGVRFGFGSQEPGFLSRSDLYVGYARALTGDVWYKDMLRVEFRLLF